MSGDPDGESPRDGVEGRNARRGEEPAPDGAGDRDPAGDEHPVADEEGPPWTPEPLRDLRADPAGRRLALAVAVVVGLGAAWVHWLGLFLAGALVGVVSRDLPRAVAAGLGFGLLVLVVHVLAAPAMSGAEFVALAPISYVTIAAGLLAPVWGALARAVV